MLDESLRIAKSFALSLRIWRLRSQSFCAICFCKAVSKMVEKQQARSGSWWKRLLSNLMARMQHREDQVFLVLALVIGALTGLAVVAFILLTNGQECACIHPEVLRLDVSSFPPLARW